MSDLDFMRRALELARKGRGLVSPNPCVGCVIVRDGVIVAEGFHRKAGEDHAEIDALRKLGMRAEGCDVYVTLEPCSHFGRTGPCAEALAEAGVRRVVVGSVDPLEKLRVKSEKLKVEFIDDEELVGEILDLNGPFLKDASGSEMPYVVLKAAMSLDGRMQDFVGRSKWITSEEARADAKIERSFCDAVLVGAETVRKDDCELGLAEGFEGKKFLRVVLSHGDLPVKAKVLRDENVVVMSGDVGEVLVRLKRDYGVQSLFVEGGARVHEEFLRLGLADRVILYYAPLFLGGDGVVLPNLAVKLDEALDFAAVKCAVVGGCVKVELES